MNIDIPNEELGAEGRGAGVEIEPIAAFVEPFDPATISIESRVVAMDAVLRRLRQNTIRLAPSFQRNFVWDSIRQSRLIESLMLRIPLPMFYVAANPDGTWDVVDGLQRLTTIRDYLLGGQPEVPGAKEFALVDLEFWGERFNGKTFSQIERDAANSRIVNNILETEMRFTVINPGTPEEVKRNIFKRINTGGMPLTLQEIRHALYQGPSTVLLKGMVDSAEFQSAIDRSIDDSRMAGRELALRFLAFHIFEIDAFDGDMDSLLSNTMRTVNLLPAISPNELEKIFKGKVTPRLRVRDVESIRKSFATAMNRSIEFFGDYAFRKGVSGQRRTPVNKALFEAWSSILSELPDDQYLILLKHKASILTKYEALLRNDDFDRAISRDSSSAFGVKERYKSLNQLIHAAQQQNA